MSENKDIIKRHGNGMESYGKSTLDVNMKFNSYKEFQAFCLEITKSNLSPHKNASDVAVAILAGVSLGISVPAALNNIISVNGKASISNNLSMGLLLRSGVTIEIIEDAKDIFPLYTYAFNEDGSTVLDKALTEKHNRDVPVILNTQYIFKTEALALVQEYETLKNSGQLTEAEINTMKPRIGWKPAGKGTKVRLTRLIQRPDGSWKEMDVVRQFTTIDADKILVKDKADGQIKSVRFVKDAWINYEDDMLFANAYRKCARIIGNDVMLNLYSSTELLDSSNINYTLDSEGEVIIDEVHTEVQAEVQQDKEEKEEITPLPEPTEEATFTLEKTEKEILPVENPTKVSKKSTNQKEQETK